MMPNIINRVKNLWLYLAKRTIYSNFFKFKLRWLKQDINKRICNQLPIIY